MNETHKRPWWRLHAVTWLEIVLVVAAIAALNLGGERRTRQPYWEHGWPVAWSHRSTSIDETVLLDPWGFGPAPAQAPRPTSRWFDAKKLEAFHLDRLIACLLTVAALIVGSCWTIERWRRRQRVAPRFSLKALLTVTASAGCYLALVKRLASDWEVHLLHVATVAAYLAIPLAWIALFDLLGIAWNRLASRHQTTDAPRPVSALSHHECTKAFRIL